MDRLLAMDKQEYVSRMQTECRRILEEVADAVNAAPTGNVISGSEMQVRDLMAELRQKAFETAVQRIARATGDLLAQLPTRHQPPPTLPPLRRINKAGSGP